MDFTLHDAFGTVFNEDEAAWDKGLIKVYENFTNDFLYANPNNIMTFIENHGTMRFNEIYKNDFKKYQMGMTLVATVRGIPQLYYGSEIGMSGNKDKGGDAAIRQDFPGGWDGDKNNAFSNSGRTSEQKQYFDFTSKLLQWRKSNEAVHFGKMKHYIPENNVYVYFRYTDNQSVMVILNNSSKSQTIKTDRFRESIQNYTAGIDVMSGNNIELKNELTIDSKSVMILDLK
jgi:glycosidase